MDLRSPQEYLAGNPQDPVGAQRDATFGLYRYDWTPRQVADALHNLNRPSATAAARRARAKIEAGRTDLRRCPEPPTAIS